MKHGYILKNVELIAICVSQKLALYTVVGQRSFASHAARLLNALPENLKGLGTATFKRAVRGSFLSARCDLMWTYVHVCDYTCVCVCVKTVR